MRYLLDTNIFIYLSTDHDKLDPNVYSILSEPETLMYISAESVRELIVADTIVSDPCVKIPVSLWLQFLLLSDSI